MKRTAILVALAALVFLPGNAAPQLLKRRDTSRTPKPEAVAETRLLMEGLNQANFRGLDKLLKEKPADAEAWIFARGQALLIAETGNLLMLRPPRNRGQDEWMDRAAELREAATAVARAAGRRDFERSQNAFRDLTQTCNRCHQAFRVPVRLDAFKAEEDR